MRGKQEFGRGTNEQINRIETIMEIRERYKGEKLGMRTNLEISLYCIQYDYSKPQKWLPVCAVPDALKLVKDAVVFIQRAEFAS